MKTIGKRKLPEISIKASAELFLRGCELNDNLHKLPTGKTTYFPKGIYRYATFEESNKHWEDCLVNGIVRHNRQI